MRFKKAFFALIVLLALVLMPVVAAPSQPIVASSYPTQSIVAGAITIDAPTLEVPATAIAQEIAVTAISIKGVKVMLLLILLVFVIRTCLESAFFWKLFIPSKEIAVKVPEVARSKGSGKPRASKKKPVARKPRAAAGFPPAPSAGATQG